MCNYANVILKDEVASEDVVQNVFEAVWKKGLDDIKQPDRYLLRAVKFGCIDWLREQQKKKVIRDSDTYLAGLAEDDLIEEPDDQLLEKITYLIATLPTKTREVFLMSRRQGYTYREISEQLGISIKTVENQMGRALRMIRTKMLELK